MSDKTVADFLSGKSPTTIGLYKHFITSFEAVGNITVHPAKTMIGIANSQRRVAWVTQLGKNFVHIVFPFKQPHPDNLCFTKIAQVPGDANQFNHHFRMYELDDINDELLSFMKLAYLNEQLP